MMSLRCCSLTLPCLAHVAHEMGLPICWICHVYGTITAAHTHGFGRASSAEPSTGTYTSAHMQPARISWPASAMSCSAAQCSRQLGSGLQPYGQQCQHLHCMQICWQATGVSLPQDWTACGRDFACWSSHSCETRTAAPGHVQSSRHRQRTSQRDPMRRDWLLVGSDIRLRAGVLSHWLRGRRVPPIQA